MMTKTNRYAFLLVGTLALCSAAYAAPSFHATVRKAVKAVQDEEQQSKQGYEWALPSIIQSGPVQRGISFYGGETYATYQGRSFELRQEQVKVGLTPQFELFYGRQFALAKGRSATSRYNDHDDYFGGRVVVKLPTETDPSSLAIQYEALRPDTAHLVTSGNAETLAGPIDNTYSLNYGDRALNQFQLSYTTIEAPAFYDAHSISLGAGHDFNLGSNMLARLQATLVGQSFTGAGISSNFELKTIGSGTVAWSPTSWLSVEGNLTVLPSGMPFASGEFTAVSSFAIYNPGGIVTDLRRDFLAFGSLLVSAHWNF
ncbi:MAG: hypothetical protein P4L46_24330 [Fimbriimonas sp.]|nr:hypothetical protein [Fimbriimonas sp.]